MSEPPAPADFEASVTGDTVTVVLRGEFDVADEQLLAGLLEQVRAGSPRRLVFRMAEVAFIDCAVARLIARTGGWLPPGVKPVVSSPSPMVRRVLEVSGIAALCELRLSE